MSDEEKIAQLSANVSRLIDLCNQQKMSNLRMSAALKAQTQANLKLQSKIDVLESQVNSLSMAGGILETNVTAKIARTRVNNLIKQVDKCISALNR